MFTSPMPKRSMMIEVAPKRGTSYAMSPSSGTSQRPTNSVSPVALEKTFMAPSCGDLWNTKSPARIAPAGLEN
jgi:hypothetical protein